MGVGTIPWVCVLTRNTGAYIYIFNYLSIHPSIYLPIYLCMYLPTYLSIYLYLIGVRLPFPFCVGTLCLLNPSLVCGGAYSQCLGAAHTFCGVDVDFAHSRARA